MVNFLIQIKEILYKRKHVTTFIISLPFHLIINNLYKIYIEKTIRFLLSNVVQYNKKGVL